MRIVIQRVTGACLRIDGAVHSSIKAGMMVLVGVETGDTEADVQWLAAKTAALRIFPDEAGVMNRDINAAGGEIMTVSQFTLTASTRKGNRPSYIRAAAGPVAEPLYELYCSELEKLTAKPVARGVFGADMQIELVNDGPVTIIIDSKLKE